MKEEHAANGKHFMIVLLWAAVLYIFCGVMMSAFSGYAFIGGVISILIFCVFGFFVLTHYTSKFTYSLKDGRLRLYRTIGNRNKEIVFACSDITRTMYGDKPESFVKGYTNMRVSVLSKKKSLYIEYTNKDGALCGTVIEPSEKLIKRIDRERKKDNGKNYRSQI